METIVTIPPGQTVYVFDASRPTQFYLLLTANVTSTLLINASAGQFLTFRIQQDATGGRTFTWPTNVAGGMRIVNSAALPNATMIQQFYFNGTKAIALGPGVITP